MKGPFPVIYSLSTGGELNLFYIENKVGEAAKSNIVFSKEPVPKAPIRSLHQFGFKVENIPKDVSTVTPAPAPAVPSVAQPPKSLCPSASSAFR